MYENVKTNQVPIGYNYSSTNYDQGMAQQIKILKFFFNFQIIGSAW